MTAPKRNTNPPGNRFTESDQTKNVPASSRVLTRAMDELFVIPGTNFRVGFDAILGLIPGIGDVIGAAISGVILADAVRNRVSMLVLLHMGWNLLFDSLLGLIPVAGDIADAAHRANVKNLRLLENAVVEGKQVHTDAKGYAIRAGILVVVILAVIVTFAILAIWGLVKLVSEI